MTDYTIKTTTIISNIQPLQMQPDQTSQVGSESCTIKMMVHCLWDLRGISKIVQNLSRAKCKCCNQVQVRPVHLVFVESEPQPGAAVVDLGGPLCAQQTLLSCLYNLQQWNAQLFLFILQHLLHFSMIPALSSTLEISSVFSCSSSFFDMYLASCITSKSNGRPAIVG